MLPYPTLTLDTLGVVGYGYAGGTLKVCSCVGGRVDVIVGTAAAAAAAVVGTAARSLSRPYEERVRGADVVAVGTAARSLSRPYEERVRGAAAAVVVAVGTAARSLSRPYPTEEDTTTEEETPDETPMAGRFVGGA